MSRTYKDYGRNVWGKKGNCKANYSINWHKKYCSYYKCSSPCWYNKFFDNKQSHKHEIFKWIKDINYEPILNKPKRGSWYFW